MDEKRCETGTVLKNLYQYFMKTCKMHLWFNKRKYGHDHIDWEYVETNNPDCFFCKEKLIKDIFIKEEYKMVENGKYLEKFVM
jgi:hypothetical protein